MVQQNVFVKVDWKSIGRCQRYITSFLVCNLFSTSSSKCVCEASKNMLMIWCFLDAWRAILMEFQHENSFFWHCREYVYKKPGRNHGCINFCISASTKKSYQLFCQPTLPTTSSTPHRVAKVPVGRPREADTSPCHAACGHARTWDGRDRREVIHSHCLFRHLMLPEFLFHKWRMWNMVKPW